MEHIKNKYNDAHVKVDIKLEAPPDQYVSAQNEYENISNPMGPPMKTVKCTEEEFDLVDSEIELGDYECDGVIKTENTDDRSNEAFFNSISGDEDHKDSGSMNKVQERISFECHICTKSFTLKDSFSKHLKLHNVQFECDKSALSTYNNVCRYLNGLTIPIQFLQKMIDLNGFSLEISNRSNNDIRCYKLIGQKCDRVFARQCDFHIHKMVHTGEKPWKCVSCGASFLRRSDLRRHERVHTKEKSFKCTICDKQFLRQSNLQRHASVHLTEKLFKCDECDRTYTRQENLTNHKRIHTGEKPFECEQCDKKFAASAYLRLHLKVHAANKKPVGKQSERNGRDEKLSNRRTDNQLAIKKPSERDARVKRTHVEQLATEAQPAVEKQPVIDD